MKDDLTEWNNQMYNTHPTRRGVFHGNPIVKFIEERRMRTVLMFMGDVTGKKILEVGCEEGILMRRISGDFKQLVGADISEDAIKNAKKDDDRENVNYVVADGTKPLPFKDGEFDIVLCSETLEHVPEYQKMADELARVLAPEGRLAFSVPYERIVTGIKRTAWKLRVFNIFFKGIEPDTSEWHVNSFTPSDLREILGSKFKIDRIAKVPFPLIGPKLVVKASKKS